MNLDIVEKKVQKPHYSITLTIDPFNKRVRVDDYLGHFPSCVHEALQMVKETAAEKLIFKVRQENILALIQDGFVYEAKIDQYYLGNDCFFFVKYFTDSRRNSENWVKEDQMMIEVLALQSQLKFTKDYRMGMCFVKRTNRMQSCLRIYIERCLKYILLR